MRDKTPLVSVTICCYNSERYIAQTIQSVLDQTFTDFELIIVNDGSTDRTEEIVLAFTDARIHYEYQENRGLAATRNRTIELARGKYIAFLDHDDLWMPEKLALQISLMETREDIAVIYGNQATIDADGHITSEGSPNFTPRDGNVLADLLLGNFVCWQTVVMPRRVLIDLGGFRTYRIVEDYDLLLRCAVDHTFVGIDRVLVKYRWHPSNYTQRHLVERSVEMIKLLEYWCTHLPFQHKENLPLLQRRLADFQYELGCLLCEEGDVSAGRIHLRRAWPNSTYKWRSFAENIFAALLGSRFYPTFVLRRRQLTGFLRLGLGTRE